MNKSRRTQDVEAVRRRQKGLRIKKGLVAGYLHELSDRHRVPAPRVQAAVEPILAEPARSA